MTWFHVSIVGNIVLGIIIAILIQQRMSFMKQCELRHNPIDEAIIEIKDHIQKIWDYLHEKL